MATNQHTQGREGRTERSGLAKEVRPEVEAAAKRNQHAGSFAPSVSRNEMHHYPVDVPGPASVDGFNRGRTKRTCCWNGSTSSASTRWRSGAAGTLSTHGESTGARPRCGRSWLAAEPGMLCCPRSSHPSFRRQLGDLLHGEITTTWRARPCEPSISGFVCPAPQGCWSRVVAGWALSGGAPFSTRVVARPRSPRLASTCRNGQHSAWPELLLQRESPSARRPRKGADVRAANLFFATVAASTIDAVRALGCSPALAVDGGRSLMSEWEDEEPHAAWVAAAPKFD